MTADELLQLVSNVLFGFVFLAALLNAVRRPQRSSIDLAVLFALLAIGIALSLLGRTLAQPLRWLTAISSVLIVAVPYALLRLADDFAQVPRSVLRAGLAGWALSAVGLVAFEPPLPTWFTLAIVLSFVVFTSYAGVAVWREANRSTGVARRRVQAIAAGALLLGVAVLAAGLQIAVPAASGAVRLLALASAIAFYVGVAPPATLRRAWQMPQLFAYLTAAMSSTRASDTAKLVAEVERAVETATGAVKANIALWDERAGVLRFRRDDGGEATLAPGEGISGRAFAANRPIVSTDPTRDSPYYADILRASGALAVMVAPLRVRERQMGVLAVRLRQTPMFAEDDLAFVQVLADQAALALDAVRLHEELAQASRAKSEFLSNMSHELRTPMNAILGFTELLEEQLAGSLSDRQRRYLTNIREAGRHLLELINDVLDLSKVEAGRIELRPETIGLVPLLEPVVAAAQQEGAARGLRFEAFYQEDAHVRVDIGRSRQILYNLLSNALKFTPSGGRVALRAGLDADDLSIEVEDTGIGIPADRRDRVFGMFERLHAERSDAQGTGLGLALTKRLVELHGGSIDFTSEEGRGTTFRVRLSHAAAQAAMGPRVLVVEDDQRDADLVVEAVTGAGLRWEVVSSVAGALAAVRRSAPTAVVLDLRLPDERGERVLEVLKADPVTRSIPVIVLTIEDDEGRSRPLGADDHITKPIDRARLTAWLERVAAPARGDPLPAR